MLNIEDDNLALKLFTEDGITLGSDLEVTLHEMNNHARAKSGLKFWSSVKSGDIGTDGRTSIFKYLVEIRPEPELLPVNLTQNIVSIIEREIKKSASLKALRWVSGTGSFLSKDVVGDSDITVPFLPKGGHIHFGGTKIDNLAVVCFDMLLAPLLLLLENPVEAIIRRFTVFPFNGGTYYGQLGGAKVSHGASWEYRTLPCFARSFDFTEAVFAIAKAILHETTYNRVAFRKRIINKKRTLTVDPLMFNLCYKPHFYSKVGSIVKILKSLELLKTPYGKKCIQTLIRPILSGYYWSPISNILQEFDIINTTKKKTKPKQGASGYICYCYDTTTGDRISNSSVSLFSNYSPRDPINSSLITSISAGSSYLWSTFRIEKSKNFSMGTRAVQHNEEIKSFIVNSLRNIRNYWRSSTSFVIPAIDGRHPAATINYDSNSVYDEINSYINSLLDQLS
jgi:hypothetical protein